MNKKIRISSCNQIFATSTDDHSHVLNLVCFRNVHFSYNRSKMVLKATVKVHRQLNRPEHLCSIQNKSTQQQSIASIFRPFPRALITNIVVKNRFTKRVLHFTAFQLILDTFGGSFYTYCRFKVDQSTVVLTCSCYDVGTVSRRYITRRVLDQSQVLQT